MYLNFPTYIAGAALLVALGALIHALMARRYAGRCYEFVLQSNKRSLTLKQLAKIETDLTLHADSIESILKSMHKLRSRIHARTVNEKKAAKGDGAPDPTTDPADWKRYMNAQFATQRQET